MVPMYGTGDVYDRSLTQLSVTNSNYLASSASIGKNIHITQTAVMLLLHIYRRKP
jgi:hypothetical protein